MLKKLGLVGILSMVLCGCTHSKNVSQIYNPGVISAISSLQSLPDVIKDITSREVKYDVDFKNTSDDTTVFHLTYRDIGKIGPSCGDILIGTQFSLNLDELIVKSKILPVCITDFDAIDDIYRISLVPKLKI